MATLLITIVIIITWWCRYRGQEVKLDKRVNLLVWQAAFLAGFAVVYGIDNDYVTTYDSLTEMVLYNGFQRLAWSLALGWVIFSCTKGESFIWAGSASLVSYIYF